jgi:3-oxoacyl-(acyl-carrier-protein) synthase
LSARIGLDGPFVTDLAVTGVGMVSALGRDVVTSCAASRAGILRSSQCDDFCLNDPESGAPAPVTVQEVRSLTRGTSGVGRMLALLEGAFEDLVDREPGLRDQTAELGVILVSGSGLHVGAWLDVARDEPDRAPAIDADAEREMADARAGLIASTLMPRFLSRARLAPAVSRLVSQDQAGFATALAVASAWLDEGACQRCLIGGVDSYVEPRTLEALFDLGLLKTDSTPTGLLPSEAGCFVIVESARRRQTTSLRPVLGRIDAVCRYSSAAQRIKGHSADGGLARTAVRLFAHMADQGRATGLIVANLDGSEFRAQEWGRLAAQVLVPHKLNDTPTWIPARTFGELGAATGPVSIAMMVRAAARRYAPSSNAVVCVMNDDGTYGSFSFRIAQEVPRA